MSQINPLLSGKRLPGSKFQLPSQGHFYEDGELSPDVINGEVMVYPMNAYDEILLKSPDLLLSGEAIERVFQRCIPDIRKPLRLLSGDVDFLTICLRSVSFGHEVPIRHSHGCDDKTHEYIVSIADFIQRTKMIDPTTLTQQFTIEDVQGMTVHFTPIRYDAMLSYLQLEQDQIKSAEELHDRTSRQLANLINRVEIPGTDTVVRDQEMIVEWVKTLAIGSIKKINMKMQAMSEWGTDIKYHVTCKSCGEKLALTVPMNPIQFFT